MSYATILCLLVSAASQFDGKIPATVIDLSCWRLTLPVDTSRPGQPDEIDSTELRVFSDPRFFFVNQQADGVIFRAPCGGATTKGSKYPRCELREMDQSGQQPAAWSTDEPGTRAMSLSMAVTKTPPIKRHVVCAQIHDNQDDLLMIRLEKHKLFIERNSQGDVALDDEYVLGTRFDLKIESGNGVVKVWYNGLQKLDWRVSRRGCYFKTGCYTQSNQQRGDAPESYGEVVIHALQVLSPRT